MNDDEYEVEVPGRARRGQYSARYKLEVLAEYEQLDREGRVRCCAVRTSTPR